MVQASRRSQGWGRGMGAVEKGWQRDPPFYVSSDTKQLWGVG